MITSFRVRLAILSMLLSGLVLAAFSFGTWWQIRRMRLARLDNDVRSHAQRESGRRRDQAGWQRTAANMLSEIGVRDNHDLLLLVDDGIGSNVYRSPDWPAAFDPNGLPWPKQFRSSIESAGRQPPPRNNDRPPDSQQENPPPKPPHRIEGPAGPPPISTAVTKPFEGRVWHIGLASTDSSRVAVAVDEAAIDAEMAGIRNAFLIAMPLTLVLVGVGGWTFSSRALHPVQKLTMATRRVKAAGLDQRISIRGEDREFVELIEVFNNMLERLERSFKQAYRFSADAAHELRTPLAILQGQLEQAIHTAEDGSSLQAELASILDEVRRLSTISRKLLLLSQADSGRLNLHREPFDLSEALGELVEDAHMLAPNLKVSAEIQPNLTISADPALLPQVLHNLISNAVKYNVENGWIRISSIASAKQVEVRVANSSRGISAGERDKVFDRFYRADSARSRQVDGFGLGLSVSREIARAHGGDISLHTNSDGAVEFSLILPFAVSAGRSSR